jgi:hypothetical protein
VVSSPLLAELRALTRVPDRLIWNPRDVENRLRASVAVYHPRAGLFLSLSLSKESGVRAQRLHVNADRQSI